jgi:sarcosine oxidase
VSEQRDSKDTRREEAGPDAAESEGIDRRSFLQSSGLGVGGLAMAGSLGGILSACQAPAARSGRGSPDVVVVGAGAFGGWTALNLREMGARVTLVDLYGPGNSRSTSGDETRGIRSGYAGRELWSSWAYRAIQRWRDFDEEWAPVLGGNIFFESGNVTFRESRGPLVPTAETWDQVGVPYEWLDVDEARYRWPQFRLDGIEAALYEPEAGVARSRAACQRVAEIFRRKGGEIVTAKVNLGQGSGRRMGNLTLEPGEPVSGDLFVFALGPWFPKAFPEIMGQRIRIPMGNVFYWGTPPGDNRFAHPNMPSWGFPGVTGWPTYPPDHRGFRIRAGGQAQDDPDTSVRWIPELHMERPLAVIAERFPDLLGQPVVETRACHYESSVTRDWIIDRHPDWDNVWLAGGGSAEGFKFGPLLGELIAGRVLDRDPHPEHTDLWRLRDDDLDPTVRRVDPWGDE